MYWSDYVEDSQSYLGMEEELSDEINALRQQIRDLSDEQLLFNGNKALKIDCEKLRETNAKLKKEIRDLRETNSLLTMGEINAHLKKALSDASGEITCVVCEKVSWKEYNCTDPVCDNCIASSDRPFR